MNTVCCQRRSAFLLARLVSDTYVSLSRQCGRILSASSGQNKMSGKQCLGLLVELTLRNALFEVCVEIALVVLR